MSYPLNCIVCLFSSLHFRRHSNMLMDRCTKMLKKTFLPVFRDCHSVKFHRHCANLTGTTPPLSCHRFSSMVRHSHNSATSISCQKLEHRSLVRVYGSDVLGFLQGLVTNDVQQLETDGSAMYAMMLNFQARIIIMTLSLQVFICFDDWRTMPSSHQSSSSQSEPCI